MQHKSATFSILSALGHFLISEHTLPLFHPHSEYTLLFSVLSTLQMRKVLKAHVNIAVVTHAVLNMGVKWLSGVLVGKLISSSFSNTQLSSEDGSPLYQAVLLDAFSFQSTVIVAAVVIVINTLAVAAEKSLAVLRSTETGRSLRSRVLRRATSTDCGATTSTETDFRYTANDLVRKISLIEDFQRNEEPLVLFNYLRLLLCVAIVFVFVWYGGLVVILALVVSELGGALIEMRRLDFHQAVEDSAELVNARLLDTIKNAVMIKLTDMSKQEVSDLRQLEEGSDDCRYRDAKLRFVREFTKIISISLVPVVIPLLVWYDLSGTDDPVRAFELGTAVLVCLVTLDEGHKSVLALALIADRQLAASDAQDTVDEFLGVKPVHDDDDDHDDSETQRKGTSSKGKQTKREDAELGTTSQLAPTRSSIPNGEAVSLEKVTVRYPGRTLPVLKNVCRTFSRGKVHGLIGESGSGKSTTMKIIANLLEPSHGDVTFWEGMKIAYVSQDQKLFARTIRENVTYGATTPVSDSDVWTALEMANIATFVKSLPNCLDEELSDGESMVSGGQLQRLHLAHLFCVWESADLVLLDECVSALDQKSRDLIIDRLQTFLNGKTGLVITHHSEMLRMCDQVHDLTPRMEPLLSPVRRRSSIARRRSSFIGDPLSATRKRSSTFSAGHMPTGRRRSSIFRAS